MSLITFDYSKSKNFITQDDIFSFENAVTSSHQMLHSKTGPGNDYTGWVTLPRDYDKEELERIKTSAARIKATSDVLVVIGIGGSYLGAKAAIDFLSHSFYNLLPKEKRTGPEIYFVGNNLSSTYIQDLLELLEDKEVSLNVISKSGTTTEPAIAFRLFKDYMEKRYGKTGARKRIYATTDKTKGALRNLASQEGYETFVVPDDVGGRYSILTAVGLLPIAASGADVEKILEGAQNAYELYNNPSLKDNPCYLYAASRNALYNKNKNIEILANYEPSLSFFTEWWKQLYGESEGKDNKGIFPAGVNFTCDLHSMGQYIQQGMRNIFETVINVEKPRKNIFLEKSASDSDGLNFLAGKDIDLINKKAFLGTLLAHNDGGVPNLIINLPELTEFYLGNLIYFFEKACGISGYLLNVNPFDQPGVEAYKRNMFALLGKAGYEKDKIALEKRLTDS